jgi:hypothetical protein
MERLVQARLVAVWLCVGAPVLWGVYETVHQAATLFH